MPGPLGGKSKPRFFPSKKRNKVRDGHANQLQSGADDDDVLHDQANSRKRVIDNGESSEGRGRVAPKKRRVSPEDSLPRRSPSENSAPDNPSIPEASIQVNINKNDVHVSHLSAGAVQDTTTTNEPRKRTEPVYAPFTAPSPASEQINKPAPVPVFPAHNEIVFGHVQVQVQSKVLTSTAITMKYNRTNVAILLVGSDSEQCDIAVTGPSIDKVHCTLYLELLQEAGLPLRRLTWLKPLQARRTERATWVMRNGDRYDVEDQIALQDGDEIFFGSEDSSFVFRRPTVSNLYEAEESVHDTSNSTVVRATRRGDGFPVVIKQVPKSHTKWAKKELEALKIVGNHPNIVRFVESFFDSSGSGHQIIFKAECWDLQDHADIYRESRLTSQSKCITNHIANGVAHLHRLGIAHRDIKPKNILIRNTAGEKVQALVCDLGVARLPSEIIQVHWNEGTPVWKAPASFRSHRHDDRLVDCYGIGRVLFFMLTEYEWPMESNDPHGKCGCVPECPDYCEQRGMAFDVLKNDGVVANCIELLEHLLVSHPADCLDASAILNHPYVLGTLTD
ncbi:hypothetical protein FRB90_000047 [Tulasnella sp. 427]|nr:hypothetical protein FRB90_000047 [Tulasnella sp. 427]